MEMTPGHAFVAGDHVLDRRASGPFWLRDPRIADLVSDTILIGDCERRFYRVHLPIRPLAPVPVPMRGLKESTARNANRILGRTGQVHRAPGRWCVRSSCRPVRWTANPADSNRGYAGIPSGSSRRRERGLSCAQVMLPRHKECHGTYTFSLFRVRFITRAPPRLTKFNTLEYKAFVRK